jgi:inner membrane protein
MDLLTHAAIGAAGAAAIAPSRLTRVAALTGAVAGVLPDADILITSEADPLLNLEFHRHFTHSLLFVPAGAAIAALLLWWLLKRRTPFLQLYAFAFVGYLLSPLLDACTSYGTHLLWPFSERAVSWNIISVVDPLFTLALLVPLVIGLARHKPALARLALLIAAAGLSIGWMQKERAEELASQLASSRGHVPERLLVKPTLANMVLWRSVYAYQGTIHVDAVRVGAPGSGRTYLGESAPQIDPHRDLELPHGSRAQLDLLRFNRFTDDWMVRHPRRSELIGDARYAMLPTSIEPLWGIVIDPAAPDDPVQFETGRHLTPEVRTRFIAMLLGR